MPNFLPLQEKNEKWFANGIRLALGVVPMRDDKFIDRTAELIDGARASGFTIDFLEALTQGLDSQALRKVIGNASSMPSYMKSSDNPYVFRSARAPSSDRR